MTEIKIEKQIPLPKKINRRIYPFKEMEVADSFKVPIERERVSAKKQNVYMAVWRFTKENPDKKFTTASEEGGVRVWRIQ